MAIHNTEELQINSENSIPNDTEVKQETVETETTEPTQEDAVRTSNDYYRFMIHDNIKGNKKDISIMVSTIYSNPILKEACSEWFTDGVGWLAMDLNESEEMKNMFLSTLAEGSEKINLDTVRVGILNEKLKLIEDNELTFEKAKESFKDTVCSAKEKITDAYDSAKEGLSTSDDLLKNIGYGILGLVAVGAVGYGAYKAYDYLSDSGDVTLIDTDDFCVMGDDFSEI